MNYRVLFPRAENSHLIRDVGMIPYTLHKLYGADAAVVTYKNGEYPYLQDEVQGLKLDFIANKFNSALEACNRAIEIKPDDIETNKLIDKIMISKRKFDMLPVLREKINETILMFSSISYTVLLRDVVNYIKYKVPNLEFNNREIKFKILEYIKKHGLSVKLDENKLVFIQPDELERKKKYII